jgi:hypothetical protein
MPSEETNANDLAATGRTHGHEEAEPHRDASGAAFDLALGHDLGAAQL